ncbi:hybrid signal transduction histidine kinase E-like [Eleutherodactylus coqui]|uniref:hybrid signal transduction histidine kinase E-like n=1 Tax=Eleutherodactylus coqui TaxID=57060 RepID=UPI003462DCD4
MPVRMLQQILREISVENNSSGNNTNSGSNNSGSCGNNSGGNNTNSGANNSVSRGNNSGDKNTNSGGNNSVSCGNNSDNSGNNVSRGNNNGEVSREMLDLLEQLINWLPQNPNKARTSGPEVHLRMVIILTLPSINVLSDLGHCGQVAAIKDSHIQVVEERRSLLGHVISMTAILNTTILASTSVFLIGSNVNDDIVPAPQDDPEERYPWIHDIISNRTSGSEVRIRTAIILTIPATMEILQSTALMVWIVFVAFFNIMTSCPLPGTSGPELRIRTVIILTIPATMEILRSTAFIFLILFFWTRQLLACYLEHLDRRTVSNTDNSRNNSISHGNNSGDNNSVNCGNNSDSGCNNRVSRGNNSGVPFNIQHCINDFSFPHLSAVLPDDHEERYRWMRKARSKSRNMKTIRKPYSEVPFNIHHCINDFSFPNLSAVLPDDPEEKYPWMRKAKSKTVLPDDPEERYPWMRKAKSKKVSQEMLDLLEQLINWLPENPNKGRRSRMNIRKPFLEGSNSNSDSCGNNSDIGRNNSVSRGNNSGGNNSVSCENNSSGNNTNIKNGVSHRKNSSGNNSVSRENDSGGTKPTAAATTASAVEIAAAAKTVSAVKTTASSVERTAAATTPTAVAKTV